MDATRRAATAPALIGIVAAVATAVIGFVLADVYLPHSAGAFGVDLSDRPRASAEWSDRHRIGSAVLLVVAVVNLALVAAFIARAKANVRRRGLAISAAIVAAVASVAAVVTRPLVEWDQLALWSVSLDGEIDGYWTAAFGSGVRFVLMGNTEVAQREYAIALVLHLAAPVISAAAFCIVAATGRTREERAADVAIPAA